MVKLGRAVVCAALLMASAGIVQAAQAPEKKATAADRVMMTDMTTFEVRDAIAAGKTTVLVFNGSIEETGAAVVLGKHVYKARYIGQKIARELGNALVAPVMPFAPTGAELDRFPGTIDLSPATFSAVNAEVVASLVRSGFKYIILMGDHGGNQEPLQKLAPVLDAKYRPQGVRVFFSGDEYAKSDAEVEQYLEDHHFPPSNHGGVADTSEVWATGPGHVRADKLAMGDPVNRSGGDVHLGPTGIEGDPRRSSPELGRMFDDIKVRNGVAEIRKLIAEAKAGKR